MHYCNDPFITIKILCRKMNDEKLRNFRVHLNRGAYFIPIHGIHISSSGRKGFFLIKTGCVDVSELKGQ